jgi:hypothetical protein
MKSLVSAVAAAAALSASFGAFAQQAPLTRAQVRADLVQVEKAGYRPGLSSPYYPENVQAAEARVHAADNTGYGAQPAPVVHAGSRAAAPAAANGRDSIFFGQ